MSARPDWVPDNAQDACAKCQVQLPTSLVCELFAIKYFLIIFYRVHSPFSNAGITAEDVSCLIVNLFFSRDWRIMPKILFLHFLGGKLFCYDCCVKLLLLPENFGYPQPERVCM